MNAHIAVPFLCLNRGDVSCARALTTFTNFVLHFLSLFEGGKTAGADAGVMYKQIITTVVGCDESKALFGAKPLYCTSLHS